MTDDLPDVPAAADLRASDADRERVSEQLRDALAEGRLDMEEFEERLDATYKARTYGELAPGMSGRRLALSSPSWVTMATMPSSASSTNHR